MTRVCHCTGHLTNPGGRCCKDLPTTPSTTGRHTFIPTPLTEERIRELIREELARDR